METSANRSSLDESHNSSEFVDLHRTVPRSRRSTGQFRILNFSFLPRGEEEARKENAKMVDTL
jgi:hypothetical protein